MEANQSLEEALGEIEASRPGVGIEDPELRRYLYPWIALEKTQPAPAPMLAIGGGHTGAAAPVQTSAEPVFFAGTYFGDEPRANPNFETLEVWDIRSEEELLIDHAANSAHRSGKWYWEVECTPAGVLFNGSYVGITPLDQQAAQQFGSLLDYAAGPVTLQFALDLDSKTLTVAKNGALGTSANAVQIALADDQEYSPHWIADREGVPPYESDRFKFNFGARPFVYPMPRGYAPYDRRFVSQPGAQTKFNNAPTKAAQVAAYNRHIDDMGKRLAAPLLPATAAKLTKALKYWKAYRDATCTLYDAYRQSLWVTVKPRAFDDYCIGVFSTSLVRQLDDARRYFPKRPELATLERVPAINLAENPRLYYVDMSLSSEGAQTEIRVSDDSAPLVILLRAGEWMKWHISLAPKVQVRQIIVAAYEPQEVTLQGKAPLPPVYQFSSERGNYDAIKSVLADEPDLKKWPGIANVIERKGCAAHLCFLDGQSRSFMPEIH